MSSSLSLLPVCGGNRSTELTVNVYALRYLSLTLSVVTNQGLNELQIAFICREMLAVRVLVFQYIVQ